MARTTSSEFVEWMVTLDKMEWDQHSRMDYYMAQLAAEIYNFRQSFVKTPKFIKAEDRLMKFHRSGTKPAETQMPVSAAELPRSLHSNVPREDREALPGEVEVGPDLVKNARWAQVNQNAMLTWGARLGVRDAKELTNGGRSPAGHD